jgi:hypothetical protein
MSGRFGRVLLWGLVLVVLVLGSTMAVATPSSAAGKWWADYFDNPNLSGSPVLSRYDDDDAGGLNLNWGRRSPDSALPEDNFSARWVRDYDWFEGGTYRFTVASDDGVRIWVGDQLVVDEWRDQSATFYVDRYIPAGSYQMRIEYYEHTGSAFIKFGWQRLVGG